MNVIVTSIVIFSRLLGWGFAIVVDSDDVSDVDSAVDADPMDADGLVVVVAVAGAASAASTK